MLELTDQNFEEEIKKSEKPLLVDFYAVWCQPCLDFGPILEKLSEEYNDKFIFAKANLDSAPLIAQKYGIDRIPAVVLFKNGSPVSGFFGKRPEPAVKEWLDANL